MIPNLLWQLLPLLPAAAAQDQDSPSYPSPEGRMTLVPKTCPRACADAADMSGWSIVPDAKSLAVCPEPVLLRFNMYTDYDNADTLVPLRACTLGNASTRDNYLVDTNYVAPDAELGSFGMVPPPIAARQLASNETRIDEEVDIGPMCGRDAARKSEAEATLSTWKGAYMNGPDVAIIDAADAKSGVTAAINALAAYMRDGGDVNSCGQETIFTYVHGTLAGFFAGSLVDKRQTAASVLQRLGEASAGAGEDDYTRRAIELCSTNRTISKSVGAVVDTSGDFGSLQKMMRGWLEGRCITSAARDRIDTIQGLSYYGFEVAAADKVPLAARTAGGYLGKRATCRVITVEKDDTCTTTLPSRCGLGNAAFNSFNKAACAKVLQVGQRMCCSSGDLPDITPKPQPDGTCAVYEVQAGEGCQAVATRNGIKESDLDGFNKQTWGWNGCGNLQLLQRVCVSTGKPPMPATYWDSVCGPTMPGSKPPTGDTKLADINPCPLKVCCNLWGKCGTTADFCTISKTATGNPGTSIAGENGCQSNCDFKLRLSGPPAQYRKVGYFEAWNQGRPCLNMDVTEIHPSYTHVHFAFGEISQSLQPMIPANQQGQWEKFVKSKPTHKKILAYGGWTFSNEGTQSGLFRRAFSAANRNAFADAVVKHANDNGLDGVDFDWEYPGATDIEGAVPGEPGDGLAYLEFLKLVRKKLPKEKSLSIAVPASYWYLRGFDIETMAKELDYIVYMTYDFHGQWDVGNKWSQEGCPGGNCLRSHVNMTITANALTMITNAGVPSNKVVVGVTSYGRSFKMTNAACRDELCTFEGGRDNSPAKPGRCTATGGYISNYEIEEIKARNVAIKSWYDEKTDTDYLVYDRVEWVAYMNDATKTRRMAHFKDFNMGGTSDWAIDLQGGGSGGGNIERAPPYEPVIAFEMMQDPCTDNPFTFDDLKALGDKVPDGCGPVYLIDILRGELEDSKKKLRDFLSSGYDDSFKIFADFVVGNSRESLNEFMLENAKYYFECHVEGRYSCCSTCEALSSFGVGCENCIDDPNECPTRDGAISREYWQTRHGPCPRDYSERGGIKKDRHKYESVWYTLKDDTARRNLLDRIWTDVGIPESRISFRKHALMIDNDFRWDLCGWDVASGDLDGQITRYEYLAGGDTTSSSSCTRENWWHGAPRAIGFTWEDVFNPKTAMEDVFNEMDVEDALTEYSFQIRSGQFEGDATELIDAIVVPIFMLRAGLEQMQFVIDKAGEITEAAKKEFILNLLSAIFFIVGGAGGIATSAALSGIRVLGRIAIGLSELGGLATGIYSAVDDPESIPLLIFGLVMGARNIYDLGKVSAAAKLRRTMKFEDISNLSKNGGEMIRMVELHNRKYASGPVCKK